MRISLAYEQGILRRPDLNRIQHWALAYYLYDQREIRRGEYKDMVDVLSMFINLDMWQAIHKPESESPADEVSEFVGVDELEDLDRLLRGMTQPKTTQEVFFDGEWI